MKRSSFNVFVGLTLFLLGTPFTSISDSSDSAIQLHPADQPTTESEDVLSFIDEEFNSKVRLRCVIQYVLNQSLEAYKIDDGLDSLTSLAEIPEETRSSARQYHHVAPTNYGAHPFVDFSPLFLALIPIALFLGAAAAFALSVATSSSTAVASAQQQQQQEENNNNNNAASNNNNNALLAALVASFTNNQNTNTPTFIIVNNETSLANLFGYSFLGRSMDNPVDWSQPFGRWWRQRRRRRRRHRRMLEWNQCLIYRIRR